MTLPSACIGVRVKDGLPDLNEALRSIVQQDYEGRIVVRVRVDAATMDHSFQNAQIFQATHSGSGGRREWHVRYSPLPETLFVATLRIFEECKEDALVWLDHDNVFYPDRIRASVGACWPGPGLCISQAESNRPEGSNILREFPSDKFALTRESLLHRMNWADSLNMRWRMDFVRTAVVPAMHAALDLVTPR